MKTNDIQEAAKRALDSEGDKAMPKGEGKHIDIHLRICLPSVDDDMDELDADTPEDSSGEYEVPAKDGEAPTKKPKKAEAEKEEGE